MESENPEPEALKQGGVLYVQQRTQRAGAQTCLARILGHAEMGRWKPILVTEDSGWLAQEARRLGVQVFMMPFPKSRSLKGRLYANGLWAVGVARALYARGIKPALVHANDHGEGLLAHEAADVFGVPRVMTLRSVGMSRRDYEKYRCGDFDAITAVGEIFRDRVQEWELDRRIALVPDGIAASEIVAPKAKAPKFPRRILVVGGPGEGKGWADLTEALRRLDREGVLPSLELDFTGVEPEPEENDLGLGALPGVRCEFLGRVEGFPELVSRYDLVINPSRRETFGMASIEVLAAGVPLLGSRTGVLGEVQVQEEFLFNPADPGDLAGKLRSLMEGWPEREIDLEGCQGRIRERFLVDRTVEGFDGIYRRLRGREA